MAAKKIRNLFVSKDKKWDKTKMEEAGEKLHHVYISGISKLIKGVAAVMGKKELDDAKVEKLATYIYWAMIVYFGITGAASLATSAGKYSVGAASIKTLTTFTKTYEISLILVGLYIIILGHAKDLTDAVHKVEHCIENPPEGIELSTDKMKELIKKGGKRPSRKTYKKLITCVAAVKTDHH
jgi:hypothetical protein